MARHVAVAIAAVALVLGCVVWLVQQSPHRPPAPDLSISVNASPEAFSDAALESLRARPLTPPGGACQVQSFNPGPVSVELRDITSRLADSLWAWRVSDRYAGPVLVRGVAADGVRVAFQVQANQFFAGEAGVPIQGGGFPELTLDAPEYRLVKGAVQAWVEVRFPEPGCYTIQADGLGFQQREQIQVG